jgi:cobalt ECF transporter T component CbiQ
MSGSMYDFSAGKAKRSLVKDRRLRLLIFWGLVVIAVQLPRWDALLLFLAVNLCLVHLSGLSWSYLGLRSLLIVPFGLGAVVLLPFSVPGETVWSFWTFQASREGLLSGLLILLKLINANILVTLYLASTPVEAFLKTLKEFKCPLLMIHLIGFVLRYLAVLADEGQKMIVAQKSRGMKMNGFLPWRTYQRIGQLLGVLFLRSFKRSERIYQAMISRGMEWREEGEWNGSDQNRAAHILLPERGQSVGQYFVVRGHWGQGGHPRSERIGEIHTGSTFKRVAVSSGRGSVYHGGALGEEKRTSDSAESGSRFSRSG